MARLWVGILSCVVWASAQTTQQRGVVPASRPAAAVNGSYYSLIIGIDRYQRFRPLQTAVSDAKAMAQVLHDQFGFETRLLLDSDATRTKIIDALSEYRRTLKPDDNLLVYYAGHGHYDKEADKAYWLPVDADPDSPANWILADDLTTDVKVIKARHVLIVSDSCYSGGLTRDAGVTVRPTDRTVYLQRMLNATSRTLMASGGNEPVADGGGSGHSVFANALLAGLDAIPDPIFSADQLFHGFVKERVAGLSEQVPQYNMIRNSGHADGDFVFERRDAEVSVAPIGPPHEKWALVVGVGEFASNDIAALISVPRDARRLSATLSDPGIGRFPAAHVTMLSDQPTVLTVRKAMNALARQAGPDDMVLLYFAGHITTADHSYGPGSHPYFLAYDSTISSADELSASSLPLGEVFDLVRRIRSRRILLLIDSGHGAAWQNMTLPPGAAFISASRLEQRAYDNLGGGLFTGALIEALRIAHGNLSPVELFRKIAPGVTAAAAQMKGLQEPQMAAGPEAASWNIGDAPTAK